MNKTIPTLTAIALAGCAGSRNVEREVEANFLAQLEKGEIEYNKHDSPYAPLIVRQRDSTYPSWAENSASYNTIKTWFIFDKDSNGVFNEGDNVKTFFEIQPDEVFKKHLIPQNFTRFSNTNKSDRAFCNTAFKHYNALQRNYKSRR